MYKQVSKKEDYKMNNYIIHIGKHEKTKTINNLERNILALAAAEENSYENIPRNVTVKQNYDYNIFDENLGDAA